MNLAEALEVVCDLAEGNVLDARDIGNDADLNDERRQQTTALDLVEKLLRKPELEMPRMLVLSTSHVTIGTANALNNEGTEEVPIRFEKRDYGWFIPIIPFEPDDLERHERWPDDLLAIRTLAEAVGCTWVMLDRDGDTVPGLPTYEW